MQIQNSLRRCCLDFYSHETLGMRQFLFMVPKELENHSQMKDMQKDTFSIIVQNIYPTEISLLLLKPQILLHIYKKQFLIKENK